MHGSGRSAPPLAGTRVGPGSSPADLEAAAAFLSGGRADGNGEWEAQECCGDDD